jgi:hypothetical protein
MKPHSWTTPRTTTGVSDNDYMRQHYQALSMRQLCAILHRQETSIYRQAQVLGLYRRPPEMIKDAFLLLAKLKAPAGIKLRDLTSHGENAVGKAARVLVAAGLLTRIEPSYRNVLFFVRKEDADAVMSKVQPRPFGVTIRDRRGWDRAGAMHCRCGGELAADMQCTDCGAMPKITYGVSPKLSYHTNTHAEA